LSDAGRVGGARAGRCACDDLGPQKVDYIDADDVIRPAKTDDD